MKGSFNKAKLVVVPLSRPFILFAVGFRVGYLVVRDAYSVEEVQWMNSLWSSSQAAEPDMWGIAKEGEPIRDIEFRKLLRNPTTGIEHLSD